MARSQTTLADVAAHVGVSPTTASYILNGRAEEMRISPDTRDRVRQAVIDLGYRPNRSARSLRTSKTATIAIISDFIASGHFASEMLAGASSAARDIDHLLLIGETGGDPVVERQLVEEFIERQVDGFVYATLVHSRCEVPSLLDGREVVLLNCIAATGSHPAVVPDETRGGRRAARAILDSGRSTSIYAVGQDPKATALAGPLRLEGIASELEAAGAELAGIIPCDWNVRDAYSRVSHWLSNGNRPRGLICMNDRVAFGAYQALAEHGLSIPDDVAVVSFDGTELASWLRPQLSSVALPFADLGATAVRVLMSGEAASAGVLHLPMPLMAAASTSVVGATTPRPGR
jgi:LacI family transcriptional regulator